MLYTYYCKPILLQTEIIKPTGMQALGTNWRYPFLAGRQGMRVKDSLVDCIAIWTQNFLAKTEISHRVINPALWILGRELCAGHF
jgi:hypothetical protein